jgi:hypothetical protein
MAASIRSSTESETFDLGGQSVLTITNIIHDAFSQPFPLNEMIRITFVTGAGKLERQKYDPDAAKAVSSTLRDLGFEEDRGASCVIECGGSFKLQHDTGKNLKTVVVFPKVEENIDAFSGSVQSHYVQKSLLEEGSPESIIAVSSKDAFERIFTSKCPSWSQKKKMLQVIESLKSMINDIDQELLKGVPINDEQQTFYDSVSLDSLELKETIVKKKMQAHVENGNITKQELDILKDQVSQRLESLEKEVKESSGKPKKIEKLQSLKQKAEQRRDLLSKIQPKNPHKLRNDAEIQKLLKELAPLQKVEDDAKGRLMTVKETQLVGRKNEILEQIVQLENSSRDWFESDEAFQARVALTRSSFDSKQKSQKVKASNPGKSMGMKPNIASSTKFVTPKSQGTGAWVVKAAPKAKKPPSGIFAAMMESDSD